MDQLKSEINRIADSSNFNGIKLLDGSMDTAVKTAGDKDFASKLKVMADGQLGKTPQPGVYSIDLSNVKATSPDASTITLEAFGQMTTGVSVTSGMTDEQLAKALADQWNSEGPKDAFAGADQYGDGFQLTAEAKGSKIVFTMNQAPSKAWTEADTKATLGFTYNDAGSGVNNNNAQQVTVTQEQEAIDTTTSRMYAQAEFKLSDVGVKDGNTLTIGNETYVFAVGADSKYKDMDNVIDLTDMTATSADLNRVAANRLTTVAKNNSAFKVGSANDKNGTISITEKEGGVDYSVNNLAGADGKGTTRADEAAGTAGTPGKADSNANNNAAWAGLVKTGTVDLESMGRGLTLQIGDTAESFNQLKVSIGDCHTKAMGIDGISISDQESAAAAVNAIKNAINYVSDVRGTLGATQNRLDHTINNLSVMTENIQDAESTIRDTDVAEEMMAYTKNNILIQSAQAMLAQANQVPQGVLQLLQ
ncbi:MAG: flagellin [Oscillospiraceae bacterium]|nr:flagellin [Oscillospiraceae bacterium]